MTSNHFTYCDLEESRNFSNNWFFFKCQIHTIPLPLGLGSKSALHKKAPIAIAVVISKTILIVAIVLQLIFDSFEKYVPRWDGTTDKTKKTMGDRSISLH